MPLEPKRIGWTWLSEASSQEGRQREAWGTGRQSRATPRASCLSPDGSQCSGTRWQWDEEAPRALSVLVVSITDGGRGGQ